MRALLDEGLRAEDDRECQALGVLGARFSGVHHEAHVVAVRTGRGPRGPACFDDPRRGIGISDPLLTERLVELSALR